MMSVVHPLHMDIFLGDGFPFKVRRRIKVVYTLRTFVYWDCDTHTVLTVVYIIYIFSLYICTPDVFLCDCL